MQVNQAFKFPTQATLGGSQAGNVFVCTSANATIGATYTFSGTTFTVANTIAAKTLLFTTGLGQGAGASGTLTKTSGTGDATIAFSLYCQTILYTPPSGLWGLKVEGIGAGGSGSGSGTAATGGNGNSGYPTCFGMNYIFGTGGAGGVYSADGGAGGLTSIASLIGYAYRGQNGAGTQGGPTGADYFRGGEGGATRFGGLQSSYGGAAFSPIGSTGCGGVGPGSNNSLVFAGTGGGSGGYFKAIIPASQLLSSYYYSLPNLNASGGTAGTSGVAGGVGDTGNLIITELYFPLNF